MATRKFPSPEMRLFTTREFSQIFSIPLSVASRRLTSLEKSGIVDRVAKGLWWQRSHGSVSRYSLVPKLLAKEQGYISFLTALNYHDVIDQIPSAIMVATTGYPRKLKTKVAHYEFIKLAPKMMTEGYDWVDTKDPYLMASPEKALLDTFYISTRKGKRFSRLPEIDWDQISKRKFMKLLKKQVTYSSIAEAIKKKLPKSF